MRRGDDPGGVRPGQCFWLTITAEQVAPAVLCTNPVEIAGRYQDEIGDWHDVEACVDHAGDVKHWRWIAATADTRSAWQGLFRPGDPPGI